MPSSTRAPAAPTLSVVVNMHREGRLVHPTLASLSRNLEAVTARGWSSEVVIVLDRADEAMTSYLDAHLDGFFDGIDVRRLPVEHGDLGLARNSGVAATTGRYVAFADADNLYSSTWLELAVELLEAAEEDIVLHPEVIIQFEAKNIVWQITDSADPSFDRRSLIEYNFWDSACVAPRRVFERIPYEPTRAGPGFGPEDWQWACETLAAGWRHMPAAGTVMFYRAKATGSLLAEHMDALALLGPTTLLRGVLPPRTSQAAVTSTSSPRRRPLDRIRSATLTGVRGTGRAVTWSLGWTRRIHPRVHAFGHALRPVFAQLVAPPDRSSRRGPRRPPTVQTWVREFWREAHELEPDLFPDRSTLRNIVRWDPRGGRFTDTYWELAEQTIPADGSRIDALFLIPWLASGGGTTVVANYVAAIRETKPDARIVVISTLPSKLESMDVDRSNALTTWVEVPETFHELPTSLQDRLIATYIVQNQPRIVHLVNSPSGFRAFASYARQLASVTKLFVSVFTLDVTAEGRRSHWILRGLRSYVDHVSAIIVDNTWLSRTLGDTFAIDDSTFALHSQPLQQTTVAEIERRRVGARDAEPRPGALRVLWAARFDRQKRPDILIEVAELARDRGLDIEFAAAGAAVLDSESDLVDRFAAAGIRSLGKYDGTIAAIGEPFDVILLTSEWEGMPLTLLDAALNDVTIVAPDVGGVSDFVGPRTGYLIDRFDDVAAYVDVLERLARDGAALARPRAAARELAQRRHGWDAFVATVRETPGYLR